MITTKLNLTDFFLYKLRTYGELLKARLSFLVAFSAGFGYLLASPATINWWSFAMLALGGFLISGASIVINQVIERDIDKQMSRTKMRPLPTDRVSVGEAVTYGFLVGLAGLMLLWWFTNPLTTFLAFISMLLYGFVYTPLKRVGPIAVFVGAVPGALPPLLGWVAATGSIDTGAIIIFAIQFVWQFPHFWSIAWVLDEDYRKAGFKLLPSKGGCNLSSAWQIVIYTIVLIPVSILPYYYEISGLFSAVLAFVIGLLFLYPTLRLLKSPSKQVALKIMFGSFLYLPLVQIAFLVDKL